MIREEMLNADGLIFVSPVYAHHVTALMKNFIDRFAYVLHRPCFLDKAALIISTTELTGLEDVLDYLEFAARLWGFHVFEAMEVKIQFHQKQFPCDYRYWQEQGWLNKDYFLDTRINIFNIPPSI